MDQPATALNQHFLLPSISCFLTSTNYTNQYYTDIDINTEIGNTGTDIGNIGILVGQSVS